MKKIYLTIFSMALLIFSPSALAQQQINNDGANASQLQPQTQGIQNNAGSERYTSEDITNDVGNSDVLKNAKAFATFLQKNGLKKGDVVAMNIPNTPQYLFALYGTFLAGGVSTGLSPLLSP